MKSCEDCKYAIFKDEGYSSYTVENTTFHCALGKNPAGAFDRFYGEDDRLDYAEECSKFKAGNAVIMDVDGENYEGLTTEQRLIYDRDRDFIKKLEFNDEFEDHLK